MQINSLQCLNTLLTTVLKGSVKFSNGIRIEKMYKLQTEYEKLNAVLHCNRVVNQNGFKKKKPKERNREKQWGTLF